MAPTPYYSDESVTLYHGDCLDVLRAGATLGYEWSLGYEALRLIPDCSVDSVVTDPPYGISFMGKEWDQPDQGAHRRGGSARPFSAGSVGIDHNLTTERSASMHAGKYDLSANAMRLFGSWCEQWATECLRVLKPGGHLLAFGGSRTWHRLQCAVEDAGFEIRDSIAWLYGSGFPKSLDVSKAIDRARHDDVTHVTGFLRKVRGQRPLSEAVRALGFDGVNGTHGVAAFFADEPTKARVPSPQHWEALRSLYEFGPEMDAEVARLNSRKGQGSDEWNSRPAADYDGRPGVAHSWRDGQGWTGSASRGGDAVRDAARAWQGWGTALKPAFEPIVVARKPLAGTVAANVLQHGTGALNIDGCRVATGDDTGRTRSTALGIMNDDGWQPTAQSSTTHVSGRWPTNVVMDESQAAELDRKTGVLTSGKMRAGVGRSNVEGWAGPMPAVTGSATIGDSGGASRFFPTFRYDAKAATSERPKGEDGTAHPTVKPLDLMRWLVRLVTPPGGTVLEPFAGSGTTIEACLHEGLRCIAIEREAAYLPLIVQRISKPMQTSLDFGEVSA